jgi:tartrate-resistant acid phosphatase type 5
VQQVVSQTGWAADNALAFVLKGTGHRTGESFEGGANLAPQLHVEFTTTPVVSTAKKFAVIGDYGTDDQYELALANMVKSLRPDFIITTGDNSHTAGINIDTAVGKYFSDYIGNYQGTFGAGSSTNKFFPTLSDNDYAGGLNNYLNYFTLPSASSGNERYYSFKNANMEFFMLNSDVSEPDGYLQNSAQATWLRNGLAASTAELKIVVSPMPPYSSGNYGALGVGSIPEAQWPYEQWGADVVISGEDHTYERIMRDANGDGVQVPFFVNGIGAVAPLPFLPTPVDGSAARYNANNGAMLVTVTDDSSTFEFWSVTDGGTLIDSYTMPV